MLFCCGLRSHRREKTGKRASARWARIPQKPELAVLLEQRPAGASLMAGMWELPEIDGTNADAARRLLDVRHSITVTNYYVTVYGYDADAESRSARVQGNAPLGECARTCGVSADGADAQSAEAIEDAARIHGAGSGGEL